MAEIDMIPPGYRRRKEMRRWSLRAGVVYIVVAVSIFGVEAAISHQMEEQLAQIETLAEVRQRMEEQKRRLQELELLEEDYSRRLDVLEGLRGGVAAKEMFVVVDRALDYDIWFRSWTFRRAGEIVNEEPGTERTGYFIVLPKERSDEPDRAWRFETHMEINAEAHGHSALASFVRKLAAQPEVEAARILSTRKRSAENSEHVEFELAVTVRSSV